MSRTLPALLLSAVLSLAVQGPAQAQSPPYSRQNPPPASFIFAGPIAGAVKTGTAVTVGYRLAIFSMKPTRIEILDADTGKILVDDTAPVLAPSALKHPTDPKIAIFEWHGNMPPEAVTDHSPAWLYDKTDTHVHLEARVVTAGHPDFSIKQPATYSAAAKAAIIQAVAYNGKVDAKAH